MKVKDGKGGSTGRGKADTGSREELLGIPSRGGKRRRAVEAGMRGRHPGGWLIRSWEIWGGRIWCEESEKRRWRVKYGGQKVCNTAWIMPSFCDFSPLFLSGLKMKYSINLEDDLYIF